MSLRSVIVLVASLTLASALVVNRGDVNPFNPNEVVKASENWDMGVQLTKSFIALDLTYVVEIGNFLAMPKKGNDMQQDFDDKQERYHTYDFLKKCKHLALDMISNGEKDPNYKADFTAACRLEDNIHAGWQGQICESATKLFLKAAEQEDFQAKKDHYAKSVCSEMQYDFMEKVKANQKAQESPFVHADDMKEEDEDHEDNENEREMLEEDINPPAWAKKDPETYDPEVLFGTKAQGKAK